MKLDGARWRAATVGALGAGALFVGLLVPMPAYADDLTMPSDEATALAETVEALTPDALQIPEDEIIDPVRFGDEGLLVVGQSDEAAALLPLDGDGTISFGSGVEVSLPQEAETESALVAEDGSVSYPASGESDVAVTVVTSASNTRINTVIPGPSASREYSYSLGGGSPRLLPDGSVEIYGTQETIDEEGKLMAAEALLGSVSAPWAMDANGVPVPTHYEIRGTDLVQVVDFTEDTAFPVVADPDLWWVIGTAAVCAAEVASLAVGAAKVVAAFAKAEKIVKAAKAAASAYKTLGGSMSKVVVLLKKYVKKKSSLTKTQVRALETFIRSIGTTVFNILGLGSCYALATTR